MKIISETAIAPSYEGMEEKRNKPEKKPKEGKWVKMFKSILQKAFSTIAVRINTAKENNVGDLVI